MKTKNIFTLCSISIFLFLSVQYVHAQSKVEFKETYHLSKAIEETKYSQFETYENGQLREREKKVGREASIIGGKVTIVYELQSNGKAEKTSFFKENAGERSYDDFVREESDEGITLTKEIKDKGDTTTIIYFIKFNGTYLYSMYSNFINVNPGVNATVSKGYKGTWTQG